jgi:hypothetical protein
VPAAAATPRPLRRAALSALVLAALVATLLTVQWASLGPSLGAARADAGQPTWWQGTCDSNRWTAIARAHGWQGPAAHSLGAAYLGVPVCGPRPAISGAPDILWARAGWGEFEWECVELAQRFMAQIYGVEPYGANGGDVVAYYRTTDGGGLVKVRNNGTAGVVPLPGDIISFRSPTFTPGHVGVVTTSSVDSSGNGTVTMLSQNDTADGWRTIAVTNWVVQGFGSLTPYGWLHDPLGRGDPLGDGDFVRVAGSPTIYRIAGGAPMPVTSWSVYGKQRPFSVITAKQFARLRQYPRDGSYVRDSASGKVFRVAGGAPLAVPIADAGKLPGWGKQPVVKVDHHDFAGWRHLRPYPMNGTRLCNIDNGRCYVVAGGAPLYDPTTARTATSSAAAGVAIPGVELSKFMHLRQEPADGTFLCVSGNGHCYVVAGGAPLGLGPHPASLSTWQAGHAVSVPRWELSHHAHLAARPVDGTRLCRASDGSCYVTAGGAPLAMPASASAHVIADPGSSTVVTTAWEFRHLAHLSQSPSDGTLVTPRHSGTVFRVIGGIARPTSGPTTAPGVVVVPAAAVANAGRPGVWRHLTSTPAAVRVATPTATLTASHDARVSWPWPVASSAVTTFDVRYRRIDLHGAAGPWIQPTPWQHFPTTSVNVTLPAGRTTCVSVRAHNRDHQVGRWSAPRCVGATVDDLVGSRRSPGWHTVHSHDFLGGSLSSTRTHGAWWRLDDVTAGHIGLLATTCRACGRLGVYVGGAKVGVVDLATSGRRRIRLVQLPAFPVRSGELRLRVLGPNGQLVRLDGIAISAR